MVVSADDVKSKLLTQFKGDKDLVARYEYFAVFAFFIHTFLKKKLINDHFLISGLNCSLFSIFKSLVKL